MKIYICIISTVFIISSSPFISARDRARDLARYAGDVSSEVCERVTTVEDCHRDYSTGCNINGSYDAWLNYLKNQLPGADSRLTGYLTEEDFKEKEENIPDGLTSNNHSDFAAALAEMGEGNIYGLIGHLYFVKYSEAESCNCQLGARDEVDYHIWVGFNPMDEDLAQKAIANIKSPTRNRLSARSKAELKALKQEAIVVEVSPHYRQQVHPDWTFPKVRDAIGKQVKVVGQLMVDNEHMKRHQDCGLPDHTADCWRKTVWELHPVIRFYICDSDAECDRDSTHWKKLDNQP
jgi:hypothetical protein